MLKRSQDFQSNNTQQQRPMELLTMYLMEHKGEHFLVSIDYFSGYIMVDALASETTDEVKKAMNRNFCKFGFPEKIQTDNGPCFKSHKFQSFCNVFDIQHLTSSPHYHESNGRVERAIQTIKQMIKKTKCDEEMTMALIAYHDTPQDASIPSPAEMFFKRRINSRLGVMFNPTDLNDTQKIKLQDKRSAHLKPKSTTQCYAVNDPIWFTEVGFPDWKPGIIESVDNHPDSYWLINLENGRRIRRNKHDIKLRTPTESSNTNVMSTPAHQPTSETIQLHSPPVILPIISEKPTATETKQATETTLPTAANNSPIRPTQHKPDQHHKTTSPGKTHQIETKTRSGRISKENIDLNFVYDCQ